jgi:hypothetical protein
MVVTVRGGLPLAAKRCRIVILSETIVQQFAASA